VEAEDRSVMATQPETPSRRSALAGLAVATVAFGAVGLVTSAQGGHGWLSASPAVVTGLATFCVLFPDTRGFGLLLAWNALGLGLGLLGVGLFSVGAVMVFPVVLLIFALATWPRLPGTPVLPPAVTLALVGGAGAALWFLWMVEHQVGG
jgi:hypothetical protein